MKIKTDDLTQRNNEMIDELVKQGKIRNQEIERAFRRVKRHWFLKGIVDPAEAYEDRAIMIKGDISSSSQPYVMAMMLEELEVQRGHNVLEIGTASGYNAALLAEIVGRDGHVYTIEVEADLAKRAGQILREVGYPGVTVVGGDGRKGYPVCAPYDRIIVTAQAQSVYPELTRQLSRGGILLIPFSFYGVLTVTVKLYPLGGGMFRGPLVGFPVSFVPMRGVDLIDRVDKQLIPYYSRLIHHLSRRRLELKQPQMVGLVCLLVDYFRRGKLKRPGDMEEMITHWKTAGEPGMEDFEFEYDNGKKDWQLIPIF